MFEAGPTPRPSSRPDESRNFARQRVAPPSTPRKNRAVAKEPPQNSLTPLDKWYVTRLKRIQEVSIIGIAMPIQPNSGTDGEGWQGAAATVDEAAFTEAMLASYRRAIASVAAASSDIRAAALRLAAIWR